MRRSIVALSFLCFFSSAFLFLFSRLRATRYSRARCFLSHSGPGHNHELAVNTNTDAPPTLAWGNLVDTGYFLDRLLFQFGIRYGRLVEPRGIGLIEACGIGPGRVTRVEQHDVQATTVVDAKMCIQIERAL